MQVSGWEKQLFTVWQAQLFTRVDQHRNEFSELQEAAGPAMDEDQGDGIGALGPLMHKVQVDGVHMHREVFQGLVEDAFLSPPVIAVDPVLKQFLWGRATILSLGRSFSLQSSRRQPAVQ